MVLGMDLMAAKTRTSAWLQVTAQATGNNIAPWQKHNPWTSTWLQAVAQTMGTSAWSVVVTQVMDINREPGCRWMEYEP